MTALVIIGILLWLFWPSKSNWHPFGGAFKYDRKTGRLAVALQLPGRKSKSRKRKR